MEQKKPLKILNVRISPELHESLEDWRWRNRVSQSEAIRYLLKWALDKDPDNA